MTAVLGWLRSHPTVVAFVVLAGLGLASGMQQPVSDDARFYVPASASYGRWIEHAAGGLLRLDGGAFSQPVLDATFRNNSEHPPVVKYCMAAGWLVLHHWTGWVSEVTACRVPIVLLWALACAAVFGLLWRRTSVTVAGIGALLLAFSPRFLFHGHAETLDMGVTAFYVLTAWAYFDCLEAPSWRRGGLAVGLFGLALASKHNAPFFVTAAGLFWLLMSPPRWSGRRVTAGAVPVVLLAMVVLSPLIAWALWPWMWFDTIDRLGAYIQFHLQHYGIYFYFGGTLYDDAFAPALAPATMLWLATPLPLLALAILGSSRPVSAVLSRLPFIGAPSPAPLASLPTDARLRLGIYALVHALGQLVAVSLPSVPKYGGVKLFLPAFPFLAVLAGLGFARMVDELERFRRRPRLVVALGAFCLVPGLLGVLAYHGAWLSYYNGWAGGVRGATEAGYERQYYDLAYSELAAALDSSLPDGGSVAILPNPKEYTPYVARWQRSGQLRRSIRLAPPERADVLVLTHERRWRTYPELAAQYRTRPVLARHAVAQVPMFTIYDLR